MLICPKCAYDNELGRIFCHQCGMKLDLDAIKPVSRGGKPIKQKGALRRRIIGLIRLFVVLLLVGLAGVMIYLMCQVTESPWKTGDEASIAGQKRFGDLERLVQGKKARKMEIQVEEVNGYLGTLHPADASVKWGFVPEQIWVEIRPKAVTLHLLMTMHVGDIFTKKLCLSWTGMPEFKDGKIQFVPESAKFGELTWPNPIANVIGFHASLFGKIADKLTIERDVLSRLSSLDVQDDRVIVSFEPH